jgi:hypothetical protein
MSLVLSLSVPHFSAKILFASGFFRVVCLQEGLPCSDSLFLFPRPLWQCEECSVIFAIRDRNMEVSCLAYV